MIIKMNVIFINCFMVVLLTSSVVEARTIYYEINGSSHEDDQIDPVIKENTRNIEDCSASATCPNGLIVGCSIPGKNTSCGASILGAGCFSWDMEGNEIGGGFTPCGL